MMSIASVARSFVAIAMIAFGVQHLVYGEFVTRLAPRLPAWIPWHPLWAYLAGAGLVVAGAAILFGKNARSTAMLLGGIILLSALLLYPPQLAAAPYNGGLWTRTGKALFLSGCCFLVARSLTWEKNNSSHSIVGGMLEKPIPLGRYFIAAFLILTGVQHFLYTQFVASLVPKWIPGPLFWTYFTAVALIAGGIGIILPMTTRLAATLTGIMIFLWVVMLHIPRALADLRDSNETTAVFEALAISGGAFLIAATTPKKSDDALS